MATRNAVVTGSSRGIGAAVAVALAGQGFDLVVHGQSDSEHLQAVCGQISAGGARATAIAADFRHTDQLAGFVTQCWQVLGSVDAWVHAAGADVLTTSMKTSSFEERLRILWQVDVLAATLLLRDVVARMQAQNPAPGGCSVTTIGWDQAAHGFEGDAGLLFGSTKGAVMALTRSLAKSAAPRVRVNCVAPGWVRTAWGKSAAPPWQNRAVAESLSGRWTTVDDVAAACAFLASDAASAVFDQILVVNGGFRQGRPDLTDG